MARIFKTGLASFAFKWTLPTLDWTGGHHYQVSFFLAVFFKLCSFTTDVSSSA